jgi:hypothetical protein
MSAAIPTSVLLGVVLGASTLLGAAPTWAATPAAPDPAATPAAPDRAPVAAAPDPAATPAAPDRASVATAATTGTNQNTFVEVTPNTVQAGGRVSIRASCDNGNTNQATVESDAFGRVVLRPDNGFLTGSVTIAGDKAPGSYGVTLRCQNGNTATTTLTVVNMSKPSQGPATGGGGTAGGAMSPYALASGIAVVAVVGGLWLLGMRRSRAGTDL